MGFNKEVAKSIREIIFGLEDGLVSTLGTLTGVAVGTQNASVVILSGLVLVAVEATSMAAGSYLSSKTAQEAEKAWVTSENKKTKTNKNKVDLFQAHPVQSGLVMWVCYALGGAVPLLPYLLFPLEWAFFLSIVITFITLFGVGAWSSLYTKRDWLRSAIEMLAISCAAALLGYVVGRIAGVYLPIVN